MSAGDDPITVTWMVVRVLDWERFAAEQWGREPVRLLGGVDSAGIDAGRACRAAVGAEPYAFPERMRAPGWRLSLGDPLRGDFALWAAVRDELVNLWWRVGWPLASVAAELAMGRGHTCALGPDHGPGRAGLCWVLRGEVSLRLAAGAAPATLELSGSAGDLLYWPPGFRVAESFPEAGGPAAVVLRLALPEGGGSGAGDPSGAGERAVLRSAAGLVPAPPPRAGSGLGPADRIRVTNHIVREGGAWAVNGHPLPEEFGKERAERLLDALPLGREADVGALCRAGGDAGANATLELLRALHRLRAVETLR
ncbi:hypothetical protein [Streptomyces sp. 6N223]|uniref:hypothetical protein n=1 Tax=Streptomyces sp. 6N223 TaxID=3457412 RepID=UPI003FD56603